MPGQTDRQKCRWKDGQTLFHRTFPGNAWGPIMTTFFNKFKKLCFGSIFGPATGLEPRTTYFINDHSTIWPNWLVRQNGWVVVCKLSGSGFESSCSHLNFRFRARFEQGVPWHSGNYSVWIHSEMFMWYDKNIQVFLVHLSNFGAKTFFWKIQLLLITSYRFFAPCQNLKNDTIPRKCPDGRTEGWTDPIL